MGANRGETATNVAGEPDLPRIPSAVGARGGPARPPVFRVGLDAVEDRPEKLSGRSRAEPPALGPVGFEPTTFET